MTVSSETNRWDYTGNGALQTYPFTAEIYVKTDLKVYVSGVLKTVDVDYTIAAASIENPAGGNVVFTTAPALSAPIAIVLNLPMTQLVDYVEGDKFPAETHERALDRLVKLIQYIKGKFSHVAKLGDDSAIELVMPNPSASAYIGWNAGATNLENKAAPILTTSTQYEVDALVTYGGGTAFTKATIDAALTAIGIVNPVVLLLRPGNWTITTDSDYSTYTNVRFKIPNGAYFTVTALKTLTFPSPANIIAQPNQQIFSGTGIAAFSVGGTVYPEWWGALGDNSNDDRPAFSSALKSNDMKLVLGDKIYKFASGETTDRLVTINPNASIIGTGKNSQIKIGNSALGVANVFSIDPTVAASYDLETITFKDFYCDLNGANNVRANIGEPARNNALIRAFFFRHIIVDGVIAENAPGNQVLWIYSPTTVETNSTATICNCRVYKVANDITGNYNGDHTSFYIQAHTVRMYNNHFTMTSEGTCETAMEFHTTAAFCENNVVVNYDRPAHIIADMDAPIKVVKIDGNYFATRLTLMFWTNDDVLGDIWDVDITDNLFVGLAGSNSMPGIEMTTYVTLGAVLNVNVSGNTFRGNTWLTEAGVLYFGTMVQHVSIHDNLFDDLAWHAIDASNTHTLSVTGNTFNEVAKDVTSHAAVKVLSAIYSVSIQNNIFKQAAYYQTYVIWIEGKVERGYVSGNNYGLCFDVWPVYFTGTGLTSVSFLTNVEIYLDSPVSPNGLDIYGTQGSVLKELSGGVAYSRSTGGFGNAWA